MHDDVLDRRRAPLHGRGDRIRATSARAVAVAALALVAGCGEPEPEPAPPAAPAAASEERQSPPATPALLGRDLYRRHECAACHESGAIPGMIPIPLVGLGQRRDEESIVALLASPPDRMPRFPLSDEERHALAAYLLATYP